MDLLLIIALLMGPASQDPIADPILDYIENPRYWGEPQWDHEIETIETFRGDISGDGLDDVFVRSKGDRVEGGHSSWEVYESFGDKFLRLGPVFLLVHAYIDSKLRLFPNILGNSEEIVGKTGRVPAFENRLISTAGGGDGNPYLIISTYIQDHSVYSEVVGEMYLSGEDYEILTSYFVHNRVSIRFHDKNEYLQEHLANDLGNE